MPNQKKIRNPYTPGAGQMPPCLAGRDGEHQGFKKLLQQERILENLVLTGLRGVGKTVLLETFKPKAIDEGWWWAGADLSESTSVTEEILATRIITDLSLLTSQIIINQQEITGMGYRPDQTIVDQRLDYDFITNLFHATPGLVSDKLRHILEFVWSIIKSRKIHGIIFAYDESQNMSDHPKKEQYPLSLLLDVFQSIQRKGIPFMLVLTGLPTLFPKLVETRTYAERLFRVMTLDRLDEKASKDAILKPLHDINFPLEPNVDLIIKRAGGYPYFIQFICKEAFDILLQKIDQGDELYIPIDEIIRKLDVDFFSGRWARASDRQRDLLIIIAKLDNCDDEFTVQEIVEQSENAIIKPFSASSVNQMLSILIKNGLIYKNGHGKYSFAVPLFGQFILRQQDE